MKSDQGNHGMNPLPSGSLLFHGRYRILRVLGRGGFGITYEAEQTALGRRVAIKEFFLKGSCERSQDSAYVTSSVSSRPDFERYRSKFLKEARTMAGMEHPHIVRIIDLFEENGTAYYVMKYLPGGSLHDIVKKSGSLDSDTAVRYVREVGSALSYLHDHRINHLDVKPGNILIDGEGHAVLIDFGLSKRYDGDGMQTSTTPVGFSEGYAPLEQYSAEGLRGFSPESDIYSLGATLYYILSGERPPAASDVLNGGLPRPGVRIPDALWVSILKAMSPGRSSRPQSVNEFLLLFGTSSDTESSTIRSSGLDATSTAQCRPDNFEKMDQTLHISVDSECNHDFVEDLKGVLFDMVYVAGGTFYMENLSSDSDGNRTVHRVTLDGYWIGRHEVTQKLWAAVMGSNPSKFKGDYLPVVNVSWYDVQKFISRLNELTGKDYRLPTEAEWEYAARGGYKSKGYEYSGSDVLDEVGWYCDNSSGRPHPVGSKLPNELGLYDMSGNVFEWCLDWYGTYSSYSQTNPHGPSDGEYKVLRGGSWYSYASYCRQSKRIIGIPTDRSRIYGFRLSLSQ